MRRYLPLIIGLFLGAISIIMGQIPTAVAQFSGMTVIGNHIGYLCGVMIVAWVYHEKWFKSFLAGFLTMVTANLTYYVTIIAFYLFGIGRSPFPPTPLQSVLGFIMWTIIAAIVCVLAATAVWMARRARSRFINYGIFIVSYAGLLGVIYFFQILPAMAWYEASRAGDFFVAWRFAGRLFEIGFAFMITTVLVCAGLKLR